MISRILIVVVTLISASAPFFAEAQQRSAIGAIHQYPRAELVEQGAIEQPERPGDATFVVTAGDEIFPYNVAGLFVVPNQIVDLSVREISDAPSAAVSARLRYTGGSVEALRSVSPQSPDAAKIAKEVGGEPQLKLNQWRWKAPAESGLYQLEFRDGDRVTVLNTFVMVPIDRVMNGRLEGYRIGNYPDTPLRGNAAYLPPRGFVRVTEDNQDTLVSPHFTVKQFLCKQVGGYPKFVILRERLVMKLEQIYAKAASHGVEADTLFVMSGFRTPWYNKAIGNVKYSRHQWGGAADIFIDADRDGYMDDLNGDGKRNVKDARLLKSWIEEIAKSPEYKPMVGGLGLYAEASHRGPFVHVDVRGYKARW